MIFIKKKKKKRNSFGIYKSITSVVKIISAIIFLIEDNISVRKKKKLHKETRKIYTFQTSP